jgi:hypothetical protein
MSPYGTFLAVQLTAAALWMVGFLALMALSLDKYVLYWFAVCAVGLFSSWLVRCPRCRESVYRSELAGWLRTCRLCQRCGLDLKKPFKADAP